MKLETAIKLAIDALMEWRKRYVVGYNTHKEYDGIFLFAKRESDKYIRVSTAIKILEGLLEEM